MNAQNSENFFNSVSAIRKTGYANQPKLLNSYRICFYMYKMRPIKIFQKLTKNAKENCGF